ncbi:stage III sporulation protein AF [Cytobacillus praedii]|uniref:Stage III sporulation protein AF n=1 Tax=Cytobacillus praedii TaxID=1742358 RepID=A0A4V2NU78_9BACI|nr:stage III sporulation protein AF [Cytobacillus praedii]MED3551080.1 stage III sporulation protein AF [Cytobacillus praedii]TCJ03291.1 stage III sporulation protein AF [Cytobacillus praedii]
MDFIKEWITNIILFVLLATVIDMLLPNSNLQKYIKMVTGLLLIAIILTPILKLVSNDFEEVLASIPALEASGGKNLENSIEMQKKEIQAFQHAYILEEMDVQLKKDVEEELMEQYGLEIVNVDFLVDEYDQRAFPEKLHENLQKVVVYLKHMDEVTDAVEVVKKVEINTEETLPSNQANDETEKVASLIAQKLGVDENIIEISVEGGKMNKNG